MSELTSVRIPVQVRDRLVLAAKARGVTVRASSTSCRGRRPTTRLAQAADDMSMLREADPQQWADYLAEGGEWQERTVERLA